MEKTVDIRPYAFIENVVTHGDYRGRGYATACLDYARQIAKDNNCYKMMLLTGSKKESTLHFFEMLDITARIRPYLFSGLICKGDGESDVIRISENTRIERNI